MEPKSKEKNRLERQEKQILKIMLFLGIMGLAFSVVLPLILD